MILSNLIVGLPSKFSNIWQFLLKKFIKRKFEILNFKFVCVFKPGSFSNTDDKRSFIFNDQAEILHLGQVRTLCFV